MTLFAREGKVKYGKFLVYEGEVVKKQPKGNGSLKVLDPIDNKNCIATISGYFDNLDVSDVSFSAPRLLNMSFPTGTLHIQIQNIDKKQVDLIITSDSSMIGSGGTIQRNGVELYTGNIRVSLGQPDLEQYWIIKSISSDESENGFVAKFMPKHLDGLLNKLKYTLDDIDYVTDSFKLVNNNLEQSANTIWFLKDGATYTNNILTYKDGNKIHFSDVVWIEWFGTKVYEDGTSITKNPNSNTFIIEYGNGNRYEGSLENNEYSLIAKNAKASDAKYATGIQISGADTIKWIDGETFAMRHERMKEYLKDEWIAKVEDGTMTEEEARQTQYREEERIRREEERIRREEERIRREEEERILREEEEKERLQREEEERKQREEWLKTHTEYLDGMYMGYGKIQRFPKNYEGSFVVKEDISEIMYCAFQYSKLSEITLPKTLISIGTDAFAYSEIKSIVIPNSVRELGSHAFEGCRYLTNVKLPKNIAAIYASTFEACYSLKSITIPGNVRIIYPNAFMMCESLTSVTLKEGVNSIGKHAFEYCKNLTTITLPSTITTIHCSAFESCHRISKIYVPKGTKAKFQKLLHPDLRPYIVEK